MQEVECRIFLIFLKFRSLYHMSSTRLGYPFIISHNSFLANNNWHGVFVLTVLPLVTLAKKMTVRLPFFWMVRCSGMQQCKSNGQEHQATGDNGGVRIEGAGPFRRLTTSTMNRARRNCSTTLVQNLLAVCASVYHQISSQQGGTYNHRVFTITQDQMDDRGIIPTLGGIDHPTPGGIVAMMAGINPMPGSITPITCGIISIIGIIVLLMAAVIVSMMGGRVLTADGRFPMMGERIGTGNLAGGTVNASAWDWLDGTLLHHLRRVSTAYAGVLLDTDGSMKWRRRKKRA